MAFYELDIRDAVATVELNRPDKLNALNAEAWDTLAPLMRRLDADRSVRVVVLRGRGRGFTAGLDVVDMMGRLPVTPGGPPDGDGQAKLHDLIRHMQGAATALERSRVPVIAAIHGPCIGGGIDLVTACDIRYCSADARFSVRETRLAMVADMGTLQRLPALVGPGVARELIYTGRDFDAAFAHRIGLVERVFPDAETLFAGADALAREIAANAPLAVQGAKRVLLEAERGEIDRGLEYVATWNAAHLLTQDLGVAVTAFVTKEKPDFSGR
ncbi:crotonase/enoyl-CoA hydratase family protein [Myxococcota bacterium]|nr:crotonase/enoyl-CoA hydratase family protein [Myxococcota bacterium]